MTLPHLANAELSIMELLWEQGKLTARSLQDQLYSNTATSRHGTVQRLLQRLEEKGFVDRDRSLGINVFFALVSRESYVSRQLESMTNRLTGGSLAPVITHLLEQEKLSPEEIERLRQILAEGPSAEESSGEDPSGGEA